MLNRTKTTRAKLSAGFSLIEMLVVLSVIAIVTAVTLSSLPSFRDNVSIDLVASQVATIVRQAQVFGASQLGSADPKLSHNYGLSFSTANSHSFDLFVDNPDSDGKTNGIEDAGEKIQTYSLPGDVVMKKVALESSGNVSGIIFLQRYPEPVFYTGPNTTSVSSYVIVSLFSPRANKCKDVKIWKNGQISTEAPTSCN